MATTSLDQFLAQIPSVTPPQLCNPLHHEAGVIREASPKELEKILLNFYQSTRIGVLLYLFATPEFCQILADLASSIPSPLVSGKNSPSLKKFVNRMEVEFSNSFTSRGGSHIDEILIPLLADQASVIRIVTKSECICGVSRADSMRVLQALTQLATPLEFLAVISQSIPEYGEKVLALQRVKRWNPTESSRFFSTVSKLIVDTLTELFEKSEIGQLFKILDVRVGGTGYFVYGSLYYDGYEADAKKGYRVPSGFNSVMKMVQEFDGNNAQKSLGNLLEVAKLRGDKFAEKRQFESAIACYTKVTSLRLLNSPEYKQITFQALLDLAKVRLQLYPTDSRYLPFVILECTMALEIDPNHDVAFLRRGRALTLLKRWNEAIPDFQRAVELNPRSPAAKELEEALRKARKKAGE